MAIKGKKKSQARGSQARRRPTPAPRVASTRTTHVPWHQTPGGRVAAAIVVVVLLAGMGVVIAQTNAAGNRSEQRREELDAYTAEIRSIAQSLNLDASAMQQLVLKPPQNKEFDELGDQASEWVGTFTGARPEPDMAVPSGLAPVNTLFANSIDAYAATATTYQLASRAPESERAGLLTLAAQQQRTAAGVWASAVEILDRHRGDEDLPPSGIQAPGLSAPGTTTNG